MNIEAFEILLVEDSMNDAEMTMEALSKSKVANKIVHLKDGAEALDYIFCERKYENRKMINPVFILLDLKMPKVNGIEVLERIKSDNRTKNIPVTVFTSSEEDPDVKKCYELCVNSYVVKPLSFESFNKVVSEIGFYWVLLNHPVV